jgi:hypothetical protein
VQVWRTRLATLFRQWRSARWQRRQVLDAMSDQRAAEELERGPATRFPPHAGG